MGVTKRETNETSISVELLPGTDSSRAIEQAASGKKAIDTGNKFLDHMLTAFARYSGLELRVSARGDLAHHLIEDVALTLGRAFRDIVPAGATRYGNRVIPMDDALVQVSVDIGGRAYYEGPLPSGLYDHFMRSFSNEARATIHVVVLRGRDRHHIVEAAFKALGLALRDALVDTGDTVSTKGPVALSVERR
ncbi:MAG TPA: imidazoleglycerol-phosphate dehydratase [Gemmatimonadaceae bacterium]|nr:imidazoleglycerol-phosphate dehydratase [Gemmatimonadaceae bacterium]